MKLLQYRSIVRRLSLILSLLLPVWFALAAKGSYWGWWPWQTGLGKLTMGWGIKLTIAAIALAALSLLISVLLKPRSGAVLALIALAIPVGVLAYANNVKTTVGGLPFIHDVSTDVDDPPQFTDRILALRGDASNPVHYVGKKDPRSEELVSVLQQQGYPDIQTLIVAAPATEVRAKILNAIDRFGWQLHTDDPAAGTIEATEKTFWFGFLDDVVIRLRAQGAQTVVDIRSTSRIGGSDMGKNAARIRRLSSAIKTP